jgi:hypothetical protein
MQGHRARQEYLKAKRAVAVLQHAVRRHVGGEVEQGVRRKAAAQVILRFLIEEQGCSHLQLAVKRMQHSGEGEGPRVTSAIDCWALATC